MEIVDREEKCPKCGSREIGQGIQKGTGVHVKGKISLGSAIIHHLCTGCGFILASYVEHPKRFR